MSKMHLRKPEFIYSTCGLFAKTNKCIQKYNETEKKKKKKVN